MLPSAIATASAPATSRFSWLNPTPHTIAVYASPWSSPSTAQHSLPGGRYPLPGPDCHRLDRASFAWRTAIPSSQWTLTTYSLLVFPAHTVKIRRDPGCTPDLADSSRRKRVARLPGVDEYEGRISHSCATYPLDAGIDGSSVIAFTPTIRRAHEGEAVAL